MAAVIILPENAINNDIPISIGDIVTFYKVEKFDVRNGNRRSYSIFFKIDMIRTNTIEWRYTDETCRDADYTRVITELKNLT